MLICQQFVNCCHFNIYEHNKFHAQLSCALVIEFVFNVPPTAKVIWRQGHGLESHPTDWRTQGSNSGPLRFIHYFMAAPKELA